jgi:hypothetical protein
MTYGQIKDLKPEDCKRACGVHPQNFATMLHVLREHMQRKIKPGRPAKLSLEDQLFLALQLSVSRFMIYDASEVRGPTRWLAGPDSPGFSGKILNR